MSHGWQIDPDMVSSNGIEMGSQTDMLRLDALIMTVQLNLRKLLEVICIPCVAALIKQGVEDTLLVCGKI